MKILISTPYYAPAWGYGGPPKLLHEFALALKKNGHKVYIITCDLLDNKRSVSYDDSFENISIYRLKTASNYLAWKHKIILPIGAFSYLNKIVKDFDFVFCSDLRHILNIAAYRACKKYNVPYSIAAYGEIAITDDWKKIFKKIYDILFGFQIAKNANYLFAQTEHEAQAYRNYIGNLFSIKIFPLAIDTKPFAKLPKKNLFREKNNISQSDKIVLFVGRFNKYKGIGELIKSVCELWHKITNIKLVLIGRDDGYLEEMKKIIDKNNLHETIIFPGALYNQDIISAYVDTDVFILTPTHSEETSLASLAALACGCPVIVNNNNQIPWLDKYNAGIVLRKNQSPYHSLRYLLTHDKVKKRMSIAARKLALGKYSWDQRVKDFENLIKSNKND